MITKTSTKTATTTMINAARLHTTPTMISDDTALVAVVEVIVVVVIVVGGVGSVVGTGVSEDGVLSASVLEILLEESRERVVLATIDDVPSDGGPDDAQSGAHYHIIT